MRVLFLSSELGWVRETVPTVNENGHFSHPVTVRGRARVLRPLSMSDAAPGYPLPVGCVARR